VASYIRNNSELKNSSNDLLFEQYHTLYSYNYNLIKAPVQNRSKDRILSELEKIIQTIANNGLDEALDMVLSFSREIDKKIEEMTVAQKYEAAKILLDESNSILDTFFKLEKISKKYLQEVGIN